jgi:hypothetical protein
MGWNELDRHQGRAVVNRIMNLQTPQSVRNFITTCETLMFSREIQLLISAIYLVV